MKKSIDFARSIINDKIQEEINSCDEWSSFLIQRYISVVSPAHCNMINTILNGKLRNWEDSQEIYHFLKCVIPKNKVYNFDYIWKKKEAPVELKVDVENICKSLEISQKEFYDIAKNFPDILKDLEDSKEKILKKA